MKSNRVMLRVEDFRAIGKAEIKLDGITVVAGVNGCGKSTLSKLLYWGVKTSFDLDKLIYQENQKYQQLYQYRIEQYLIESLPDDVSPPMFGLMGTFMGSDDKSFSTFRIDELNNLKDRISTKRRSKNKIMRFWDICFKLLAPLNWEIGQELQKIKTNLTWEKMIDFLIFFLLWIDKKIQSDLTKRPNKYFINKIEKIFHINDLYGSRLEIWEDDVLIVSNKINNMMTPFEIDNVIYIDTPMFFGHTEEEHWKDANEKLKQRPKLNEKPKPIQEIDDLIKRQIFRNGAEVKFDELSESFTFRTSSGVEMDLSDSATGMKTFAVLDRLVKNGSINKKTLLILDEPEAHLHPQWIVELGRLLTLINKHIGAKIFVATHSPDMVQALRYIPNKEGTGDNVNFYLAEFNQENGLFDYRDLQGEIDDIFGSFNLSLDKLSNYGED